MLTLLKATGAMVWAAAVGLLLGVPIIPPSSIHAEQQSDFQYVRGLPGMCYRPTCIHLVPSNDL